MTPLVAQNLDDKGEITEANKPIQRGLASEEEERQSSQNMEEQSAQNKVTETAFQLEQAMEKMSHDHETVGGEIAASGSMKTSQKKRLLGGIKKTKTLWETWYETIKEEEKLQSNKDVTVQCIDFCEVTTSDVHAVLRHAPADLRGGSTPCSGGNCGMSGKPNISSTDTPCSQVSGLSRCVHTATGIS